MTLTSEDVMVLRRPFSPDDHEFHPFTKFAYVKERAISERLEEVDPAFEFRLIGQPIIRVGEGGKHFMTVLASMIVKGVTRDGVGTVELYTETKNKTTGESTFTDMEAEKGAATDALKRCARQFGVGRYLTDLSKSDGVSDAQSLEKWLKRQGLAPSQSNNHHHLTTTALPKERRQVTLFSVKTRATANGGWKYTIATTRDENDQYQQIVQYERGVFKVKGYVADTGWQSDGNTEVFQPPVVCWIRPRNNEWEIEPETFPPFNPFWEALAASAQQLQELPGMPVIKEDIPF